MNLNPEIPILQQPSYKFGSSPTPPILLIIGWETSFIFSLLKNRGLFSSGNTWIEEINVYS